VRRSIDQDCEAMSLKKSRRTKACRPAPSPAVEQQKQRNNPPPPEEERVAAAADPIPETEKPKSEAEEAEEDAPAKKKASPKIVSNFLEEEKSLSLACSLSCKSLKI